MVKISIDFAEVWAYIKDSSDLKSDVRHCQTRRPCFIDIRQMASLFHGSLSDVDFWKAQFLHKFTGVILEQLHIYS